MKKINKNLSLKMEEEAIYRLKKLGLNDKIVGKMQISNDTIFISEIFNVENVGLVPRIVEYRIAALPEQIRKAMKNCLPYFGINYGGLSLFYVSPDEDEWELDRDDLNNGNPTVYVYNGVHPDCSEFGNIGFEKTSRGLIRTA